MTAVETTRAFFADYETRFNHALAEPSDSAVDAVAAAFADCFVGASPAGVSCGANDDRFREQVGSGLDFYRRIGMTAMTIQSVDVTPLDDRHTMARVHWRAQYRKSDDTADAIDFDVIYLVHDIGAGPHVFAFIAGDEQQALRERGLIPTEG